MGVTIGNVLISYDVNRLHPEVKSAMLQLGYSINWRETNNTPVYVLPNTTLWHTNKSSNQGIADIKAVCLRLGVTLEKAIAVKATEFVGV